MSADVLRSPSPSPSPSAPSTPARTAQEPVAPFPAARVSAAIEPSLVNRLLGVAAAVFAVPVLIELQRALMGGAGPTPAVDAWLFTASAALAGAFALVLRRAPGLPALRAGRALCAALALEAAVLGAALASQLAR
jgi:hypothetical protein